MTTYDPYDEALWRDPRPVYDALLSEGPLHRVEQYDTWAVVEFDAVWQVCLDTEHFTCTRGQTPNQVMLGEPTGNTFPELDPPEHRLRRRVLAPEYTRAAAKRDEPVVRELARTVLSPLVGAGEGQFDVYGDYAAQVTARVAAYKTGLPTDQALELRHRMDDMFARVPGQRGTSPENLAAIGDVFGALIGIIAEAHARPEEATGHLAQMLNATVDGEPLTDEQIAAELHTIMVTGSETTELSVAATVYELARDPELLARVRADRTLVPWAFAEAIRTDHPTNMLCRGVKRNVDLAGAHLREGQGVLLLWGAANRDPAVFEDPARFDVDRRPARNLLFGHGQHKCLGEHLAMTMGTVLLEEFLDAVDEYEVLEDSTDRLYGEFLKGWNRLPIRYRSAKSR
jgi:cytochrome P450